MVIVPFAARVLTGEQADLDGVCVQHGETACVVIVGVQLSTVAAQKADARGCAA